MLPIADGASYFRVAVLCDMVHLQAPKASSLASDQWQWRLACVEQLTMGRDGVVRTVHLRLSKSEFCKNLFPVTCPTKFNQSEFMRHVAATNICKDAVSPDVHDCAACLRN